MATDFGGRLEAEALSHKMATDLYIYIYVYARVWFLAFIHGWSPIGAGCARPGGVVVALWRCSETLAQRGSMPHHATDFRHALTH